MDSHSGQHPLHTPLLPRCVCSPVLLLLLPPPALSLPCTRHGPAEPEPELASDSCFSSGRISHHVSVSPTLVCCCATHQKRVAHRNASAHVPGGYKFKIEVSSGGCLLRLGGRIGPLLVPSFCVPWIVDALPRSLASSSHEVLCVCVCPCFPLYRDTGHKGLGPHGSLNSC